MIDLHLKDAALFIDMVERLVLMAQVTSDESREMIAAQLGDESWRAALENDAGQDVIGLLDAVGAFVQANAPKAPELKVVDHECEFDIDLANDPDGEPRCVICGKERP